MGTIIFIRSIRHKVQFFFSNACFDPFYHPISTFYYTQYKSIVWGFL